MSSARQAKPDVGSPPLLLCALMLLDPRRWVGALLAILGVLVSIIAPFLPTVVLQRIFHPAAGIPSAPHQVPTPKRPSPTPVQSSVVATGRRVGVRPRSSGDPTASPHVTFSFDPQIRSVSASSLIGSSSHSIPTVGSSPSLKSCLLPPHHDIKSPSPPHSRPASPASTLPPASPYFHPHALPSLESLDLASGPSIPITQQLVSQNTKRHFKVQIPKLGFGRRRSTTEFNGLQEVGQPSPVAGLPSVANDNSVDPHGSQSSDTEWRGTSAFAVKRSNTIAMSPVTATEVPTPTPLPPRRKFSLFSRDPSSGPSGKGKDPSPSSPALSRSDPITPVTPHTEGDVIPPVPALPSPTTLKRMVESLPLSAIAGSSKFPASSPPVSRVILEDMIPLEQTTTPPARPARTDPYKTYGVPVPGSERARAFLKAEKEWIRAEKERKERERTVRVEEAPEQGVQEEAGEGSGHGHGLKEEKVGDVEKGNGPEHVHAFKQYAGKLKKGKDSDAKRSTLESGVDAGEEADAEDEKSTVDEFGVLPVMEASSPSQAPPSSQGRPTSSQGRRSWMFSRRTSDVAGDKEEKRREKKDKEKQAKDKDKGHDGDSAKAKKRPKSRDGPKKSLGFRSKERGKGKDRGYSSDTGVPSLTYKLMA